MGELKGRHTYYTPWWSLQPRRWAVSGYDVAMPQLNAQTNRWTATEYNQNNSWNSNFGNGNVNNNNKYNQFAVRPVVASDIPADFLRLVSDAFDDCCVHKRTSADCIAYVEQAASDLRVLARELYEERYQPGVSTCFLVKYPKVREVFASGFRDRIVHHFIFLLLNPYFEARFRQQGDVSFNCRKGFGTLAAQRAAYNAIYDATDAYRREAWVFRGDLVSFFMSINKRLLWTKLKAFIDEVYKGPYKRQLTTAVRTVVFHCPADNCRFNTDPDEWPRLVEESKSLFGCGQEYGMPIGNLTTQVFANFLMSEFDEWAITWLRTHDITHHNATPQSNAPQSNSAQSNAAQSNTAQSNASQTAAPRYVRFVDDFIVVSENKTLLKLFVREARKRLKETLGLTLHTDKHHFQPASHGVKFVGAYLKNGRTYLANRTLARFAERIHGFCELLNKKTIITTADLSRIEQVTNSYLGFCKGKRTYARRRTLLSQFPHRFYHYFYIQGHYESIKRRRHPAPTNRNTATSPSQQRRQPAINTTTDQPQHHL